MQDDKPNSSVTTLTTISEKATTVETPINTTVIVPIKYFSYIQIFLDASIAGA